jgi:tRNA A-37 threonylcarbamoyl transferase component Bud32
MTLDVIRPERDLAETKPEGAAAGDPFDELLAQIARAPEVPLEATLKAGTGVGGFEILELIGKGAFGTVYRAVHPTIGKEVAIKLLSKSHAKNPLVVRRFVEEARAVSRLGHPNIVDIFGFGELQDGTPYYVMELLRGKTLSALIHEREVLPVERVVTILAEVASALEAAHQGGILHRDLKPGNVFLTGDIDGEFKAKLLDFGVAKFLDGSTQVTEAGMVIGTPGYMSPEQCTGDPLANTSDIYALGVLAFELLTGRHPFSRENNARVLVQHLVEVPPPVSSVAAHLPCALDAPVSAMLEKDPTQRPQSAKAAVEALRQALLSAPPERRAAPGGRLGGMAGRSHAGRRRLYALAGLIGLSLVTAVCIRAGVFAPTVAREKPVASPLQAERPPTAAMPPAPMVAPAAPPSEAPPAVADAKTGEAPQRVTPEGTKARQPEKRATKPNRRKVSARGELEF